MYTEMFNFRPRNLKSSFETAELSPRTFALGFLQNPSDSESRDSVDLRS